MGRPDGTAVAASRGSGVWQIDGRGRMKTRLVNRKCPKYGHNHDGSEQE